MEPAATDRLVGVGLVPVSAVMLRATVSTSERWTTLFVVTRVVAGFVALALLVVHRVTDQDAMLFAVTLPYVVLSLVLVLAAPPVGRSPAFWVIDSAIALALILAGGEWRSPFYLLGLSSLVLPCTMLTRGAGVAYGAIYTGCYLGVAFASGLSLSALDQTVPLETLTTHLMVPMLVAVVLAYGSELLERLAGEQRRVQRLAIEAERQRIGWELHDSAKQRIHAASLLLSSLNGRGRDERVEQALRELGAASADMETSVRDLNTPLEERDLVEALQRRGRELASTTDADIQIAGVAPALAPFVNAHAYRIASEALTNAVRHSRANRIRVAVGGGEDALSVTVSDDGAGMPTTLRPGSAGLRSMDSRATTIGGTLRIAAGDQGRGTVVHLEVPLTTREGKP